LKLLSKGLKFTPLPPALNRLNLKESINNFARSLRLSEYFHGRDVDDNLESPPIPNKFRKKSSWNPPPNRDKFLDVYITLVEKEIMSSPEQKAFPNLAKEERQALKELKNNKNIIIREADKGSAVVLMDRTRYEAEGYRQLDDRKVYERVGFNEYNSVVQRVNQVLDSMRKDSIITDEMHEFAKPKASRPARFYVLPKVHKAGVPGRPVVSACGAPTEGLSEIVDHFLQPLMTTIPSYIKDTNDFLRKVRDLGPLPPGTLLATIDVTALYPSIPHDMGVGALRSFLSNKDLSRSMIDGICDMTETVLKNNVFEFNSEFFIQTSGTAIGTKMAPTYANIFMSVFEGDLLSRATTAPFKWFRYIDDVFLVWTASEASLMEFMNFINTIHPNIQFTSNYSTTSVNFLDVLVTLETDGTINTDLYNKPTDTHQYLHWISCHPNHTKKSIPYSQAMRILRICSKPETAEIRCQELSQFLLRRGYNKKLVRRQIQRAFTNFHNPHPRTSKVSGRKIFFGVEYHPSLPDISGILRKFLPVLHQSEKLRQAIPDPPILSFHQPKNLSRILCRAKLPNTNPDPGTTVPCHPCGSKRCQLCPLLITTNTIKSYSNGRTFFCKNEGASCNSTWLIYAIWCQQCGMQYVGQTNNVRLRMNGHKSDLRKHINGSSNKQSDSVLLYQHLKSHSGNFSFQILEVLENRDKMTNVLRDKKLDDIEREWIWRLDSVSPKGLNIDDGYHVQNRGKRKTNRT
jgi:hypothetical protein